jgi:hypothetical protein
MLQTSARAIATGHGKADDRVDRLCLLLKGVRQRNANQRVYTSLRPPARAIFINVVGNE